jgi:hypothetical protein
MQSEQITDRQRELDRFFTTKQVAVPQEMDWNIEHCFVVEEFETLKWNYGTDSRDIQGLERGIVAEGKAYCSQTRAADVVLAGNMQCLLARRKNMQQGGVGGCWAGV